MTAPRRPVRGGAWARSGDRKGVPSSRDHAKCLSGAQLQAALGKGAAPRDGRRSEETGIGEPAGFYRLQPKNGRTPDLPAEGRRKAKNQEKLEIRNSAAVPWRMTKTSTRAVAGRRRHVGQGLQSKRMPMPAESSFSTRVRNPRSVTGTTSGRGRPHKGAPRRAGRGRPVRWTKACRPSRSRLVNGSGKSGLHHGEDALCGLPL
jgi:hypothetical protein